jgi:lipoyl synthase
VQSGRPEQAPEPLESFRLAATAARMELKHVVVASVDRDDLHDKGAGHFAATIRALKAKLPAVSVEVLTPDFLGYEEEALQIVLAARVWCVNSVLPANRMFCCFVMYDRIYAASASTGS